MNAAQPVEAANINAPAPVNETKYPPRAVSETLRQMRDAKRIEQLQEEDARQLKQAASSTLSQRLAQAAGQTDTRNSGALNAAPRVRTAPFPATAGRNSGKLGGKANTGKLVAEASGLREHPQAGFYIRLAAAVLGVLMLGGGLYFYRNQRAQQSAGNFQTRNLNSSEDEVVNLVQKAEQARQTGQIDAAAEKLNEAIKLLPDQPEPRQVLAETMESSGRTDDALQAYNGLLKVAPENLGARLKLAELHRAKGNVSEARAQYQRIIALDQRSPEASRALEAIEEIEGSQTALASSTPYPTRPRRVAGQKRLGPVLPPAATARGQVALVPQNPFAAPSARALLNWTPVRPLEAPDPHVAAKHYKDLGQRYINVREFNAAIAELQQAVKLTPGDKDLYYLLGSSYRGIGQNAKAHEYYKQCDTGPYAATSQTGAKQTEKAARKELERQQKDTLNSAQADKTKSSDARPEARKNVTGKDFQNSFQER